MNTTKKIIIFILAFICIAGIVGGTCVYIYFLADKSTTNEAEENVSETVSTEHETAAETQTQTVEITTEETTTEWETQICGVTVKSTDELLDVSNKTIPDIDDFAKQLETLPALKKVDMCGCGFSNEQMEQLCNKFPDIKFVWELKMGIWTLRTDAVAFSTLKDGTIYYRLTNDDAKVLKYCTDMVALDIGHNRVTDLSFLQYMPDLRILILVDNMIENDDETYISDLSMLKYCKKLMYLEFFVGSVSDISVLADLKELVDLNISYNPISDITPLLELPKLERLFLEHTNVSLDDYKLLQETYPDAQIVYYGEGSVDQGWRTHERYYAMKDMYKKNYVNDLFK
ncbi:MAG: leucine-rich repeat domain-containing protein [Lachnospira sp.]